MLILMTLEDGRVRWCELAERRTYIRPKRPGQWTERTRGRRTRRLERAAQRRGAAHNRWCDGMWKIHVSGRRVWRERKFNPVDTFRDDIGRF